VRLDHLLSKEHTPFWGVAVVVALFVVVLPSGIIDIPLSWLLCRAVAPLLVVSWCGVGGGGGGTLLGF
jgi:hypothetical protein